MADIDHIHPYIRQLAKENDAEVTLTGATWRGAPVRNQALLNGRFVGFYAQEAFGGDGKEGWQLGSARIKGSVAEAAHFVQTGELPVDGVAAPRKALPADKKEEPTETQTQLTALVNPTVDTILARLQLIKELKAVGTRDELIAAALKG